MRLHRLKINIVDFRGPLQIVKQGLVVLIFDPATLKQRVAQIFVLALNYEHLTALHSHRFLPGLHVPALLPLLCFFI